MQGAPGAGVEVGAVVEHARALAVDLDRPGLRLAVVVVLEPVGLLDLLAVRTELPGVRVQLVDERADPLLVVLVREVGTQRAAADFRGFLVDPGAALPEDARVVGRQPGEVAAEHLRVVGGIDELDEGTGKDEVDFGHGQTLRGG